VMNENKLLELLGSASASSFLSYVCKFRRISTPSSGAFAVPVVDSKKSLKALQGIGEAVSGEERKVSFSVDQVRANFWCFLHAKQNAHACEWHNNSKACKGGADTTTHGNAKNIKLSARS
jgi:hypothetical protein